MQLPAGIYAVTGTNGSGKSTLFRVLMSCNTNEKSIDLPESIIMGRKQECEAPGDFTNDGNICDNTANNDEEQESAPMTIKMPSSSITEISQTFYWPLYTKPMDWIYQCHLNDLDEKSRKKYVTKIVEELQNLLFTRDLSQQTNDQTHEPSMNGEASRKLEEDLLEEKEDWFNDLSGGQKSKVELVRKVHILKVTLSVHIHFFRASETQINRNFIFVFMKRYFFMTSVLMFLVVSFLAMCRISPL